MSEIGHYMEAVSRLKEELRESQAREAALRKALQASWPGISGQSYERPISEVHALVTAALAASSPEGER